MEKKTESLFKHEEENPDLYQKAYELGQKRAEMGLDYLSPFDEGEDDDDQAMGFTDGYNDYYEPDDEEDDDI